LQRGSASPSTPPLASCIAWLSAGTSLGVLSALLIASHDVLGYAPAVGAAIYEATGIRPRSMPMTRNGLGAAAT
jgi:hypothetical protein